jgi:hypothetical protein
MQDMYDVEYGIYNHLNNNHRPLSSVGMHPAEEVNEGSLLEEVIRTYISRDIGETYKLNLLEFLELPIDIIDMLLRINDEEKSKKSSIMDEVEKKIKK